MLKDANAVSAEVMHSVPIIQSDSFLQFIKEFCSGIDQSALLEVHRLEGLAKVIEGASTEYTLTRFQEYSKKKRHTSEEHSTEVHRPLPSIEDLPREEYKDLSEGMNNVWSVSPWRNTLLEPLHVHRQSPQLPTVLCEHSELNTQERSHGEFFDKESLLPDDMNGMDHHSGNG